MEKKHRRKFRELGRIPVTTTVSLSADLLIVAKQHKINISAACEEGLFNKVVTLLEEKGVPSGKVKEYLDLANLLGGATLINRNENH